MIEAQPVWVTRQRSLPANPFDGMLALVLESVVVITCLSLSFASYPHHLRTSLWGAGAEHGWNSDPHERVYFYANYETPPPVPFIWSEGVAQSNVAVAAVGIGICLSRWTLKWFKFHLGCIELLYDLLMCALWAASLAGQSASDMSDHDHLSLRPWYLGRACAAVSPPASKACALMQAQWAASNVVLLFYAFRCWGWTLYVAYCYGQSQRSDAAFGLVDLVFPSDQESGGSQIKRQEDDYQA